MCVFVYTYYVTTNEIFNSARELRRDNRKLLPCSGTRFTLFKIYLYFYKCGQTWWGHYLWLPLFHALILVDIALLQLSTIQW